MQLHDEIKYGIINETMRAVGQLMYRFHELILTMSPYLPNLDAIKHRLERVWVGICIRWSFSVVENVKKGLGFCKDMRLQEMVCRLRNLAMANEANGYEKRSFYSLLIDFTPYIYGEEAMLISYDVADRVWTLPTCSGQVVRWPKT